MGNCARTLSYDSDSSFGSDWDSTLEIPTQETIVKDRFYTPRGNKWPTLEAVVKYLLNDFNNMESEEVREACLYVKKELISRRPKYFDNNTKLSPPHKKNKWASHWVLSDIKFEGVYIVAAQIVDFTLISQCLVYIDGDYIELCEFKKVGSMVKKENILQ